MIYLSQTGAVDFDSKKCGIFSYRFYDSCFLSISYPFPHHVVSTVSDLVYGAIFAEVDVKPV